MIQVSVEHNIDAAIKALDGMGERVIRRAAARALNRVASQVRTQAAREIKDRYRIGTRLMSKYITVARRASGSSLYVEVKAEGRPLPLMAFQARQTRKGVTVEIVKGNRVLMRRAFIARMKSGHEGVFARASGQGKGGYLWGKFCALIRVEPSPSPRRTQTFGYTMRFGAMETSAFYEGKPGRAGGTYVKVAHSDADEIVGGEHTGYLWRTVVA